MELRTSAAFALVVDGGGEAREAVKISEAARSGLVWAFAEAEFKSGYCAGLARWPRVLRALAVF